MSVRETRRIAKYQVNTQILTEIEREFKEDVNLLKLHNIDVEFLEEEGITSKELHYIVASFRAAGIYYILDKNSDETLSDYRKNLLNNPKVKIVYEKILRKRIIPDGSLINLIDKYYSDKKILNKNKAATNNSSYYVITKQNPKNLQKK